jgi:hypothetical protein
MSVIIEIHKIKAVKVGGDWMEIDKNAAIADEECEFQDEDEETVGEFAGGVLSFKGTDGEDYVVSLADVQAFRMK